MASLFQAKYFNPEVVALAVENIKSTLNLKVIPYIKRRRDNDIASRMPDQKGGNIGTIIVHGNLGGDSENYDGNTNITTDGMTNYAQTVVAIGRAHGWQEEDFQTSIGGYSEMDAQIYQLAMYQDKQVKLTFQSILKGLFASGGALASKKVSKTGAVAETDLIDLLVKSAGDLAGDFDIVCMDSYVAGELAKLKLLSYGKYVENGIEKQDPTVGYWAGKFVIIDDTFGTNSNASASVHGIYAFAPNSWRYADLAVKVPFERARDAKTKGGVDEVIERQRFILAPEFVSFKPTAMAGLSPTNAELESAGAWELVKDGNGNAVDLKVVPFACLEITLE